MCVFRIQIFIMSSYINCTRKHMEHISTFLKFATNAPNATLVKFSTLWCLHLEFEMRRVKLD